MKDPFPDLCQILFTELMKELIRPSLPPSARPDLVSLAEQIYTASNITQLIDMARLLWNS